MLCDPFKESDMGILVRVVGVAILFLVLALGVLRVVGLNPYNR